ncbi:MAG: tetratricopeptide repeat protein, partial [Verrucomicrobiota bacterium]
MQNEIKVFIASPGDLSAERRVFREAIDQLNVGFGDGANIKYKALGWEDTLASTGRRSQSVINEEIDQCDVFILTLYRRWGQSAPDAAPYTSYTEEEFHRALERWKKEKKPEIFVFFKRVDSESEADPGPQLKKVMDFRRHLEETRQVLYHYFTDEDSFLSEIDQHLRAFVKGCLPKSETNIETVILPLAALEEVEQAKETALKNIKNAEKAKDAEIKALLKIEALQLEAAEDAAILSKDGKIEFAQQKFSQLIVESSNLQVLFLGYEFFHRIGDLESARKSLTKSLDLSGRDSVSAETASAYGNLGILYRTRGELDHAEEMYQKSLAINEALGRKEGMANQYGNLGILYSTRGE